MRIRPGRQLGWLVAIMFLGLLLRGVGLGWESIWYDEADSLQLAKVPISELITGEYFIAGNPGGYFALLRLWCLTFGFSIESARAFSVVAGTLVIPLVWLLGLRATGSLAVARVGAFLTAINPALVFLSREARVFPLMSVLITLAILFLLEIVRHDSKRAWLGLTIVSALSLQMHYNTFFFLATVPWPILWGGRDQLRRTILSLLTYFVAVGIMFLPWISTFTTQLVLESSRQVSTWFLHAIYFPVYAVAGRTLIWKQDGVVPSALIEMVVVFAILVPLLVRSEWSKAFTWVGWSVVFGVPLAAFLVSLTLSPVFNGRYVSFVIPCLMVILAVGIQHKTKESFWKQWLPAILLGLLMVVSLVRLYTGVHKDDWRGLAEYVGTHGPQQRIVFYEEVGRLPFGYYRPDQPIMRILKVFDGKAQSWEEAGYRDKMRKYNDFWFVISPELSDTQNSEVINWLRRDFEQTDYKQFRGLKLLRFIDPQLYP